MNMKGLLPLKLNWKKFAPGGSSVPNGASAVNIVFFSFSESDRDLVLNIKKKVMNPQYTELNFMVQGLLKRWDTDKRTEIRRAISKSIQGVTRTIVFVGKDTYKSPWVVEEVKMTLNTGKPVYAIRLEDTHIVKPACLSDNNIYIYPPHEDNLQYLATRENH